MANNAVVGVLRALLTADTAQYEGGMRKAAVITGQFGKEVQKLTPQAERMARAFSGDRILAQANNLVAAVNKVGGAAKLTEAEQRRVNNTLTEAIAKYRALGQTAPAAMVAAERATRQADVATSKWGTTLDFAKGALAALGVTLSAQAVIGFARELLTTADNLVRVADRTGLTTTEVQKLEFVARQSGNTIEDFTSAIGQLQNRLIGGDRSAVNAVKVLGLNLAELKAASPFEQISQIATAIGKIPDPAARAAIAIDLFGRTGAAILPTLISDFNKLADAAPQMSDATVRALDQAGDALDKFRMQMKVWAAEAFNFAGRLFDQFVIFLRRGAAEASDTVAKLFDVFQGVGPLGRLSEKLHADAQLLRDAADASALALERQETEVRKNTTALIDYDALLNRATPTTDKAAEAWKKFAESVRGATFGLQLLLRDLGIMPPAIQSMNVSLEDAVTQLNTYSAAWRDTRVTMERLITAVPTLGAKIDDSTTVVEDASQSIVEFRSTWDDLVRGIGDQLTRSISDAFGDMLVGLRGFKDGFVDIWRSIQRALSNILAAMLDEFIGSFLKGMLRAIGAARLGQALGNALAGSAAGAAIGGGTAAAAGGAGAGTAGAGGAGMGGSFLTNPAFWTNPITLGVLAGTAVLTWGIKEKGWFRGGEEALKVNPRRDQFIRQFGSHHGLAATLTARGAGDGGGSLMRALNVADTVREFEAAQGAIIAFLTPFRRGLKSFAMGGFVPPGVVQPALLHGGSHGEMIVPLDRPATVGPTIININANIRALDGADVTKVWREQIVPLTKRELLVNQDGLVTAFNRAGFGNRNR